MDWTNVIWLGLGFGFGGMVGAQWQAKRRTRPADSPLPIPPPHPPDAHILPPNPSPEQVQQLQLAYHMLTEMSQFKGGFLARVSHELRSPLNGLIGMHQLILTDLCDTPEEEREFIAQANTSAQKMVKVLDEILEVARLQHGTMKVDLQPIQLAGVMTDVYNLTCLPAQDRNVRLQLLPVDPTIYVRADLLRLRQVLLHLVDAAVQRLPEDPIVVSVEASPATGHVCIRVNDHCPAGDRSEPIHLLDAEPGNGDPIPSPGLTLLADQILLQLMQGRLEVIPADPSVAEGAFTQIQCVMPMISV